jgi:predicted lipoprotein with Yx(FWY)xxD motif
MHPMRLRLPAALVTLAVLFTGCGGTPDVEDPVTTPAPTEPTTEPTPDEPTEPGTTEPAAPSGTTITTGDSPFGTMLFDDADQAIYIWELEPTSTPECYDDCAVAWPPVLTEGDPVADGEVDADLLGVTERTDGSQQVTYNDHPLYYYAHEEPGEVKCHNIATHGGLWWVIQPDGDRAP